MAHACLLIHQQSVVASFRVRRRTFGEPQACATSCTKVQTSFSDGCKMIAIVLRVQC